MRTVAMVIVAAIPAIGMGLRVLVGRLFRAVGRTELGDDAQARRDADEQRRWADFAAVMDAHTRSPK